MQHEVTVGEWQSLGFELPPVFEACTGDACPIDKISWSHALAYANALSAAHSPPLEPCYELQGCRMYKGSYACGCIPADAEVTSWDCSGSVVMSADTVYDCDGYRLPTRAEWQYAARAGVPTAFYSGPITQTEAQVESASECAELHEAALEDVAWYCANSSGVAHAVGKKRPNAFGIHDLLGNVAEMLHDRDLAQSPTFPARDPFGELGTLEDGRPFVGGRAGNWPSYLRIAGGLQTGADQGLYGVGFRLARTLRRGKLPTVADVPFAN